MDGGPATGLGRLPRVLDNVLQRVRNGARLEAGEVLISPDGSRLRYAICLHFSASNNTTECEALINGLRIAIELGVT